MCEFYLDFPLPGNGTPRKYVEDELAPINDSKISKICQTPYLGRREFIIENQQIGSGLKAP